MSLCKRITGRVFLAGTNEVVASERRNPEQIVGQPEVIRFILHAARCLLNRPSLGFYSDGGFRHGNDFSAVCLFSMVCRVGATAGDRDEKDWAPKCYN